MLDVSGTSTGSTPRSARLLQDQAPDHRTAARPSDRLGDLPAVEATFGPDFWQCLANGFEVNQVDQSFMDFADGEFDFLWCRHLLEQRHTAVHARRVPAMNQAGRLGLCRPPRTGHFRLPREQSKPLQRLPAQSWFPLLSRVGFALECDITINFTMTYGPDTYRSYIVRRRG